MFENISYFFKRMIKPEQKELGSKDAAKERLHLVLMQDRANVSADFLELMKQEIIDVIKKYIVVDESSIDVRLTNKANEDGTTGAPALYANIPIMNIKNDMMAEKEKKFEGVDFNKEMGLAEFTEEELQEKLNPVVPEPIVTTEIEENKTTIIENYNDDNEENEESQNDEKNEDFIDDDEDDDVTFDDLLKAAEAEERANKEFKESEVENDEKNIESDINAQNDDNENDAEIHEQNEEKNKEVKKSKSKKRNHN